MHSYAKFPRLLLWLLLTTPALAAERELSVGPPEQTPVILSPYLDILEDPSRTLSLAQVQEPALAARFKSDPRAAASLNFGLSQSAYWLRLRLTNTADQPSERMLEIGYSRISRVTFYQPDAAGSYQIGRAHV